MRRLTAGGIALFAMTWAGSAFALGLGEMEVRSHLNQGFAAVVPVVGASEADLENFSVQLAGSEAFARAGLERADYLSTLKFSVETGADGAVQLKIRSNDLAREPFLAFVIEVRWSGGKLVREYTALLDPPSTEPAPAPKPAPTAAAPAGVATAPAAAPAATGEVQSAAKPVQPPVHRPAKSVPVSDAESAAGSYGPVEANETLWRIATKLQPSLGGTIDQILLALYQKNPAAFEGGSIDVLMKGASLKTPSAAELRAIDPGLAQRKVADLRGRTPTAVAPKPETPAAPASAPTPAKPTETAKPEAVKPEPAKPAPIQPPNLKGILPAEGGNMVPAPAAPPPAIPAPAVTTPPPPATVPPPAAPPAEAAPATPEAAAPAPAAVATPDVTPPQPAPAPAPAADGGVELPLPLPALAGLGALLLGVLALLLVRRRRAAAAAGLAPFAGSPAIGGPVDELRDVLLEPTRPSQLDAETLIKPPAPPIPRPASPAPEPELPAPTLPDRLEFEQAATDSTATLSVAPEATDPLADADFHLSYGLHEEAANILKAALAKEPTRLDLKLKLADVYFAGRRGLDFQELAEQLRPQVDTADWKHIVELGRQLVPNASIFRPTMSAPGFGALGDVDLDQFDLGGEPATAELEPPIVAKPVAAPPLDLASFDLASGDDGKPERIEFNLDELDLAKHEEGEPSFTLGDEFDTKLDLARAYADMGDSEAALNLLSEVVTGGNEKQKLEAKTLHDRLKA